MNKLGIYIHWPYCISKCPYCDFNSHKIQNYDPNEWLSAYENQIKYFKEYLVSQNFKNIKLSSIFLGGGTPSLMPPKLVEKILLFINKLFNFDKNIEITLESNPTNLELNKISDFKSAGVNRVSLGVQGLNDTDLKYLGRLHNASETFVVLDLMQKIIDNISVDLIYALSCQNLEIWNHELQTFLKNFSIKHLSAYQLVIEKGTKFYHLFNRGELKTVSDNLYKEFYFSTKNILKDNKFDQYEISNFSKPNFFSKHNTIYWKSDNWIGVGPGAISRIWNDKKERIEFENFKKPETWLKNCLQKKINLKKILTINFDVSEQEILMMGLRLNEGVDLNKLQHRTFLNNEEVLHLQKQGIINIRKNKLMINENYFNVHDYIVRKIIDNYLSS
ncbi:MAG: coproporphyrinogen III oxidase [Alphaproteobacteria bacterium]|nr:MAG: coproporphyrinogen III oxidase [Alphaproteobacteria bacterium]